MDGVDLERIGIQQHQAEIGLVPADDRRLQPRRGIGAGRIERGDELPAGPRRARPAEPVQARAVEAVVQMAAMPAFGRLQRNLASVT